MKMTPTKKITMWVMIATFILGWAAILTAVSTQDPDCLMAAMVLFLSGNLLGILGIRLKNF